MVGILFRAQCVKMCRDADAISMLTHITGLNVSNNIATKVVKIYFLKFSFDVLFI